MRLPSTLLPPTFISPIDLPLLVFICGNGGANPRHATLFARDVAPSLVIRILDRFLMYYIRTADRLMRTARWLESMEGGIEVRKALTELRVVVDDVAYRN